MFSETRKENINRKCLGVKNKENKEKNIPKYFKLKILIATKNYGC